MTRIQMRSRDQHHVAYAGRAFLITNLHGMVMGEKDGFFYENTRLLSRCEFTVDGSALVPMVGSTVAGSGLLAYYQLPPSSAFRTMP